MTALGLVIEFFGAAGAGKTFVARSVAECLRRHETHRDRFEESTGGLPLDRKGQAKAWTPTNGDVLLLRETIRPARFSREWLRSGLGSRVRILRHPVHAARLLSTIRATGQANSRECRRLWMAWVKTVARLERFRKQHSVILMDHGCFQTLWTIGYGADPDRWCGVVPAFRQFVRPPDLLVIVDADPATAIRRLRRRRQSLGPTSRIQNDNLDSDQTRNRLADFTAQISHAVIEPASARFGFPILRLDNDRDERGA